MKGQGNRYYSSPLCPQLASSLQAANLAKVCTAVAGWPAAGNIQGDGDLISVQSLHPPKYTRCNNTRLEILLCFPHELKDKNNELQPLVLSKTETGCLVTLSQ